MLDGTPVLDIKPYSDKLNLLLILYLLILLI
ncbi:hypothetical protein [Clostridium botulinum]|nr:hypothetical protein C7M60_11640 [Clostridium botulinum]AVQ49886.1 hypothetical protein C7M58_11315 [Clostridium botulinum]